MAPLPTGTAPDYAKPHQVIRAVEWQVLLMGPLDSPEAVALQAKADWLRNEYEGLIKRAEADGRPIPPPFPTDEGRVPDPSR